MDITVADGKRWVEEEEEEEKEWKRKKAQWGNRTMGLNWSATIGGRLWCKQRKTRIKRTMEDGWRRGGKKGGKAKETARGRGRN